MSWRFRKGIKLGPIRLTMTTRGLAASVGAPFARLSINTRGEVRRTVRVPGVGLYETQKIADLETPFESKKSTRSTEAVNTDREQASRRQRPSSQV